MYGKMKKLLKTMKCKKPKVTLNLNGQDLFKMTDLIIDSYESNLGGV